MEILSNKTVEWCAALLDDMFLVRFAIRNISMAECVSQGTHMGTQRRWVDKWDQPYVRDEAEGAAWLFGGKIYEFAGNFNWEALGNSVTLSNLVGTCSVFQQEIHISYSADGCLVLMNNTASIRVDNMYGKMHLQWIGEVIVVLFQVEL